MSEGSLTARMGKYSLTLSRHHHFLISLKRNVQDVSEYCFLLIGSKTKARAWYNLDVCFATLCNRSHRLRVVVLQKLYVIPHSTPIASYYDFCRGHMFTNDGFPAVATPADIFPRSIPVLPVIIPVTCFFRLFSRPCYRLYWLLHR